MGGHGEREQLKIGETGFRILPIQWFASRHSLFCLGSFFLLFFFGSF